MPLFRATAPSGAVVRQPSAARLIELGVSEAWKRKNPTFVQLQQHYAPANWGRMMQSPRRAYTWVCPTVGALDEIYGPRASEQWVDQQITALFLTSASREGSAASETIGAFVSAFTASVSAFRLSELMLFFARYKSGLYDRSFATFDVRRIGQAFHHEFLPERRRELGTIEEQLQAERALTDRDTRAEHAVSYARYHTAPRRTRYGISLRFRCAVDSAEAVKICRYLGIGLPLLSAEVQTAVTRHQMRMVVHWAALRRLEVGDSWELSSAPSSAPHPQVNSL